MKNYIFLALSVIYCACSDSEENVNNHENGVLSASVWKANFENLIVQNPIVPVITTFIDSFVRNEFLSDTSTIKLSQSFFDFGSSQLFSNPELARLSFRASINAQSNSGIDSFNLQSVRALINIGFAYLLEGDHLTAIKYFDSVVKFQLRFPLFPTIFALILKGESLAQLGELEESIKTCQRAESIFMDAAQKKILFDADAWSRARKRIFDLYVQMANTFILKREFNKAVLICDIGITVYRQYADPPDTLNGLAALYLIKGNSLLEIAESYGNLESKKMWLNLARQAYHTSNAYYKLNGNPDFQVFALNNIGATFYKQYQYEDALNAYQDAISQNLNNGNILDLSQYYISLLNRGSTYYKLGRIDEALDSYHQLLGLIANNTSEELPNIRILSKDYNLACFLLGSLGRSYLTKNLKDASSQFKSAAAYDSLSLLLNYMRGNLIKDHAKVSLAQKSRLWIPDAVIDMASLYYQTGNPEFKDKVFHFIEHSKAFSLLEASRLNNAGALLPEHLQKLQNEISKLQLDAINNKDLEAEISSKQHDFFDRLQKEAPAYYALKYQGIRNHPKQVQDSILDADQTMLEYFIHDSLLLILAIQKDTFLLDTVHIEKRELFNRVSEFRAHMNPVDSTGRISDAKQSSFCKQSFELYQLLVGRIKNRIRLNQRLVIIPDGSLNDLSFDALLCQWDPDQLHIPDLVKNEQFLVQQHAISYCFSASLLEEMKKGDDKPSLNSSLALFAPDFHKSSALLPYMNYQKEEIHKIQTQIPSSHLVNLSSKENFIRATKTHAFMHIATHGFESPDPDQSFIAFNQTSIQPDTSQFLFLKELYHIPMRQELLTLTACETALGPLQEGEGNISLARGFAYAGVKAMITTLWKIQTNGASKIIPEFYRHYLVNGKPKDVALSESKRAYLKAGKAVYPDEWAGLILIGNAAEFAPKPKVCPYLWILFGTAMIITFIYFLKRKKSWFA